MIFLSASITAVDAQIVCDFANDSITFCFDKTYTSTGGCSMDSVTTGFFFFSRAEDSMGNALVPSFQTFSGDDGTGMTASGNPNEYCITFDILTWFNVTSVEDLQRITFAIRNKPGTAFLTSSCVNNPFGYYSIIDLASVNQQVVDAGNNSLAASFSGSRDTVCVDTTASGIEDYILDGGISVYPNPMSNSTIIEFTQSTNDKISASVADMLGRTVRSFDIQNHAGKKVIHWDGRDQNGSELSNGIYNILLTVDGYVLSQKISLLK
ncbi:MAG: T9SS type A sorting domain-containing protein [Chitinophagales bacterium]|nr:T9SS type A sorting domain-containing protein [Chitinophagales bacterium]